MWKSINAIAYFKLYPTIDMNRFHEVVFFDEFFGDVAQFDVDILRAFQRCLEIEIFNVKSDKLGAFTGKDDVDQELDEVEGSGLCSGVSGISYVLDCNSDASAIGIRLLGGVVTKNL